MAGPCQKQEPVLALPIFPGRRQPSIVGRNELNYRVRNGNGWTLALISTNSMSSGSTGEQTVLYCIWLPLSSPFHFSPPPSLQTSEAFVNWNEKAVKGVSFRLQPEANDPELAFEW